MTPKKIEERWGKPVMDRIWDQMLGLPVHVLIEQILLRMPDAEIEVWASNITKENQE
jgi:hypothetical protein